MSAHTPGPWVWSEDGCCLSGAISYPDGYKGAEQVLCIDLPEFIEPENKALIAAAPELLDALIKVQAFGLDDSVESGPTQALYALIDAAIAKAEGKQS